MSEMNTAPSEARILRIREVTQRTGICRSTIYELMSAGDFPKPVRPTPYSVGWIESEVARWIHQRVNARDTQSTGSDKALGYLHQARRVKRIRRVTTLGASHE